MLDRSEAQGWGYALFIEVDGTPLARLPPIGDGDDVEVLWWSHRDK